jgi:hypothetical protein
MARAWVPPLESRVDRRRISSRETGCRRYRFGMSRMQGFFAVVLIAATSMVLVVAVPATAISKSQVQARTLSLSEMPTGWSVDHSSNGGVSNVGGCLKGLQALKQPSKGIQRASVSYDKSTIPALQQIVEAGKGAAERYRKYNAVLAGCKAISFVSGGSHISGNVGAMSFPTIGDQSSAYAMNVSSQGVSVGVDIVLFKAGQFDTELVYEDYSPDVSTVQAFATEALNKIEGKPTVTPTTF